MKQIKKRQLEQELVTTAKEFLKKSYGLDLTIPIKINKRLSTSLGRFRHYRSTTEKRPFNIELSGRLLEYGTSEQIMSTLKHELIHYALYMLDKPFKDGQAYFENELIKHESCSTRTQMVHMKNYIYSCGCSEFKSPINRYEKGYRCSTCKNDITLIRIDEPKPLRKII